MVISESTHRHRRERQSNFFGAEKELSLFLTCSLIKHKERRESFDRIPVTYKLSLAS